MSHKTAEELSQEAKNLIVEYLDKINDLKTKDRMKIPAQEMPSQDPDVRNKNLEFITGCHEE